MELARSMLEIMVNTMVLVLWRYIQYLGCRTHFCDVGSFGRVSLILGWRAWGKGLRRLQKYFLILFTQVMG